VTGPASWLAALDDDDREQFLAEMREALTAAGASRDAAPVETCLREWRTTAGALSDPQRRAVLTSPCDDGDFAEAERP
jgi:hypothetical protein